MPFSVGRGFQMDGLRVRARAGSSLEKLLVNLIQILAGLQSGGIRFKTGHDLESVVVFEPQLGLPRHGNPKAGCVAGGAPPQEFGRHDADDGERRSLERYFLAQHRSIARESAVPIRVADEHYLWTAGPIIFGTKKPPD